MYSLEGRRWVFVGCRIFGEGRRLSEVMISESLLIRDVTEYRYPNLSRLDFQEPEWSVLY